MHYLVGDRRLYHLTLHRHRRISTNALRVVRHDRRVELDLADETRLKDGNINISNFCIDFTRRHCNIKTCHRRGQKCSDDR